MGAFLSGTMVLSSVMLYSGVTETLADDKMSSEHYHTFTCYAGYVVTCSAGHEKSEHREECFAGTGKLVCGIDDRKLHSHSADTCYVSESVLSCDHSGNSHDSSCYTYVYSCRDAMALSSLNEEGGVRNEDELKEAISVNSGVIKLTGSFSVKDSINIGTTTEIDLNGYHITYLGSESLFNVSGWGNKLIIRDSTYAGLGKVVTEECNEADIAKYNAASDSVVWYTTESSYSGMSVKSKVFKNTLKLGSGGIGSVKATGAKAIITLENNGFLEIHGGLLQNANGMNIVAAPAGHIDMFGGYLMNSGSDKDSGGAVYVKSGSFEMFNGAICGNRGRQGGAVRGDTWTSIGLYGGIIAGNSALYNGGALYTLNSSVDINNAVLVGNTSGEGGGAYYSYISRNDVGKLTIKNSTFAGNSATTGGAIHLNNAGYEVDNKFATSVIVNNTAKTGGGLYVENSVLVCEDTDISFNDTVEDGAGVRFIGNSLQLLGTCKLLGNVVRDSQKSRLDQNLFDMNDTRLYIEDTCILEREYTVGEMNEVSSWRELKHVMESAQDYVTTNVKLMKDIEADSTIVVKGNPDLQLQLNGNKISNGNLRGVHLIKLTGKGAGLTVTDSANADVETVKVGVTSAEDAGKLGTYYDGIITYYTAVSKTLKGGLHTEEMLYKNTIDLSSKSFGGFVCTGLDSIINALNGSTLIIDGGVLQNEEGNHAVRVEDGSVCKINGGYIIGSGTSSSVAGNYDDGYFDDYNGAGVFVANNSELYMTGGFVVANKASADGGGIFVRDADVVRLTGGVIAGNSADIVGGGVSLLGDNSDVLLDGVTVAGNRAKGKLPQYEMYDESHSERVYGGGGVFSSSGTELVIDGDTLITENIALSTSSVLNGFGRGGGAVFSAGACLIYGGQITCNKSYASGGGVYSTVGVQNKDTGKWSGSFKMSGGIIASNVALKNEGGGIRTDILNDLFAEDGKRIYITNNMTKTVLDFGGGGLFNTSGSTARTGSLVITDNEASGFGGGVSGCNNGITTVLPENGAAIYGNTASADSDRLKGWKDYLKCKEDNRNAADKVDARTPVGDIPFIEYGMFEDFYVSNEGHVSGTMLGGGSANWKGSGSDDDRLTLYPEAKPLSIRKGYIANNINYMGLKSNPSQASVKSALAEANIIVTGNKSGAHGGGIANNGNLTIGKGEEPDPEPEETTTTSESEETTSESEETTTVPETSPEETSPVESTAPEETTAVPETSSVETTTVPETSPVETTTSEETSPIETTESVTATHDETKQTVPETTRRSGGGGSQPPPHGVSEPQTSSTETTVPQTSSTAPREVVEMPPEETFNFFNPTFPSHTIYESLPNPNNPDSPDFITIFEDGVPKSYFKRWNKDTMQYEYIPDDMVPTGRLPKVGDRSNQWVWRMLFCMSLLGLCMVHVCAVIDNRIQRAGRD